MATRIPLLPGGGVPSLDFSSLGRLPGEVMQARRQNRLTAERLQDIAEARGDRERQRTGDAAFSSLVQSGNFDITTPEGQAALGQAAVGLGGPRNVQRGMGFIDRAMASEDAELDRKVKRRQLAQVGAAGRRETAGIERIRNALPDDMKHLAGTGAGVAFLKDKYSPETMTPYQKETLKLARDAATQKQQETEQATQFAKEEKIEQANTVAGVVDKTLNLIQQNPGAVGTVGGKIASVWPGSARKQIEAISGQIKGNLSFKNITDLKRAGVSLGALSDTEREVAGNLDAALDPDLPPQVFMENLLTIRSLQQKIDPSIPDYQQPAANVAVDAETESLIQHYLNNPTGGG